MAVHLGELISDLTRRHQATVEQLTNLFASDGGPAVIELAGKVMGPGMSAVDWLTRGQLGLQGEIPAIVALDPEGRERVTTLLMQIEYGVYV